jgi:hypothetical protein
MAAEVDSDRAGQVCHHGVEVDGIVEFGLLAPGFCFGAADHEVQTLKELQVLRLAPRGHYAATGVVDQVTCLLRGWGDDELRLCVARREIPSCRG